MTSPLVLKLVPFVFVLLWSTGFIGARYAMPYAEPFTLLTLRMALAAGAILVVARFFKIRWPNAQIAWHSGLAGIFIHASYLGGVFAAIKLGMPAGMAALIVGMQPLLTALFSRYWFGERLQVRQIAGLLIGMAGVVLVLAFRQPQNEIADITLASLFCTLIALIGISFGTLYQKRYCGQTSLLAGTFYQYVATTIVLGILALMFETNEIDWTMPLLLSLIWLIVVLSLAAVLLLMLMIREGQATTVASYFYLTPPVTVLLAWLLFDEQLGLTAIAGLAVASLGVYLARPTASN